MKSDTIKITILDDGNIKLETDQISQPNHGSAEIFVREVSRLLGGTTTTKRKGKLHHHGHTHTQGEEQHQH